jgi:ubiquinone/menaquinone biosynthesis C-methylase UbiE
MSQNNIRKQYQTDKNLNARIALHRDFSTNTYPWFRWVFDHYNFPTDAHILELGCGPVDLWRENADRIPAGWNITLTDFSEGMIASARRNLAEVDHMFTFQVVNAHELPFDANGFDVVLANHMLYHVPDISHTLVEIHRVLKPGGRLCAATNGEQHMAELWQLLTPYIPNCYEGALEVAGAFLKENGAAKLMAAGFEDVVWEDYPNDLAITEVEPLIAYIQSSDTLMAHAWTEAEMATLHAEVASRIETEGIFTIQKSVGMFVAHP